MYILRDLKWNREQVKRKTFFKRRKIFEWQKGIRLPRGRAAQEAKAAPEMMQHELELSTAECQEDRAGSWLRYLGQSLSTAGGSRFIFCGSAQALDRKDMGTWSSAISGWYVFSEIRLHSTWAEQQNPALPILGLVWPSVVSARGHKTGGISLNQGCPSLSAAPCKVFAALMAHFFWVMGSETSRMALPPSHFKHVICNSAG